MNKHRTKTYWIRCLALWLAFVILISTGMVGCAYAQEEANSIAKAGSNWIVSDLFGAITADTEVEPRDDFHAAVNREWFAAAEIPAGYVSAGAAEDREAEVRKQILALLNQNTAESHEARLV